MSARPNPGMSGATARAKRAGLLAPGSVQSSPEPGLPCTNTTASRASRGPAWSTGSPTPRTVMRVSSRPAGAWAGRLPSGTAYLSAGNRQPYGLTRCYVTTSAADHGGVTLDSIWPRAGQRRARSRRRARGDPPGRAHGRPLRDGLPRARPALRPGRQRAPERARRRGLREHPAPLPSQPGRVARAGRLQRVALPAAQREHRASARVVERPVRRDLPAPDAVRAGYPAGSPCRTPCSPTTRTR